MRLSSDIKAILFHLQKKDGSFDDLTPLEKNKCEIFLDSLGYTFDSFFSKNNFEIFERSRIIFALLKYGVDINQLVEIIDWKVFENIIALIFSEIGYTFTLNYRFKDELNKYEIDVLSYKFPYLFTIDCKYHKNTSRSFLVNAAKEQNKRVEALIDNFPFISSDLMIKLSLPIKRRIQVIPLVISWKINQTQMHYDIPIVPYNQIFGFIQEIDEIRENFLRHSIELQ